jgi:hypothetical protein
MGEASRLIFHAPKCAYPSVLLDKWREGIAKSSLRSIAGCAQYTDKIEREGDLSGCHPSDT